MVVSSTPKPDNPCLAALLAFPLPATRSAATQQQPIAVAFSGGADSTALLLAAHSLYGAHTLAIHIHHGMQAAADDFAKHCRDFCEQHAIAYCQADVAVVVAPGQSSEDAARRARYPALASLAKAQGARAVLLAQHADDQVETLLLALTRGAGLPGLAAMPAQFERDGMRFLRPLLALSAEAIRHYLQQNGIAYIDDPMNQRMDLTRGKLRHALLPVLAAHFPSYRATFARSAAHAWSAQSILTEIAADDLDHVGLPPQIQKLQSLSAVRQANVLRHWLREAHGQTAQAAQLDELIKQIAACSTRGHHIRLKLADGFVERDGAELRFT